MVLKMDRNMEGQILSVFKCFNVNLVLFKVYISWRRMEKINWTDHVRNEEVLLRVKE